MKSLSPGSARVRPLNSEADRSGSKRGGSGEAQPQKLSSRTTSAARFIGRRLFLLRLAIAGRTILLSLTVVARALGHGDAAFAAALVAVAQGVLSLRLLAHAVVALAFGGVLLPGAFAPRGGAGILRLLFLLPAAREGKDQDQRAQH